MFLAVDFSLKNSEKSGFALGKENHNLAPKQTGLRNPGIHQSNRNERILSFCLFRAFDVSFTQI